MKHDEVNAAISRLANATIGPTLVGGVGVDVVDIKEFTLDVEMAGAEFLNMCFLSSELAYCEGDVEKLAGRFALKEATLKTLGTGIRGIGMRDVCVETAGSGAPSIRLSHDASLVAKRRRLNKFRCSATHESGLAIAIVVANTY